MAQMHRLIRLNFLKVVTRGSNRSPEMLNLNQRLQLPLYRAMCTQKDLDKPVKFSSSDAASWKAAYTRSGGGPSEKDDTWFEPWIVLASVTAFLVYFCILREENDIDDMIYLPLHYKIDGLEESQLRSILQYNLDRGLPTSEIQARIDEIEKENLVKTS